MAKKETSEALYLEDPDTGRVELVHGADVEDRKANGWKEPEGKKANGEDWNGEDSLGQRNAAAEQLKIREKLDAEKEAKKQKEREEAEKAAEKARKDAPPPKADMTVEIVDPKAAKAK
jgi:hypothetical protein